MIRALLFLLCLAPGAVLAQGDPAATARRAAERLDQAAQSLSRAEGSRDRVAALTGTIRAYEDGLAALREGLRQAAAREAGIRASFERENARLGQLLGVLQGMSTSPETVLLLHPSGPVGTARSGMLLSDVTPALLAEVADLRSRLDQMATLRALQVSAEQRLQQGLRDVQEARTRLSQAVSDRTDLPRRLTEEPGEMLALIESAETLEGFASGLTALPPDDSGAPLPDFAQGKGALRLPVRGRVLRAFRDSDAAGIRRPGLVLATAPGALVTAPWPATLRYRGPLLDYGNVIILEPGEGYLLVLAGLETVYGDTGQVLPEGAPLGLMPGADAADLAGFRPDRAAQAAPGGDAAKDDLRYETLYMELREGQTPVDPAAWFALDEE